MAVVGFTVKQTEDGRWRAEVCDGSGTFAHGDTPQAALDAAVNLVTKG